MFLCASSESDVIQQGQYSVTNTGSDMNKNEEWNTVQTELERNGRGITAFSPFSRQQLTTKSIYKVECGYKGPSSGVLEPRYQLYRYSGVLN